VNNPVLVGILMTDDKGNFAGSLPVPTGLSLGVHIFQVDAYTPAGTIRTASFQAIVQATVGKVLTSRFYFAPTSTAITAANIAAIKKLAAKIPIGYTKLNVGVIGFVYPYDTKAANLLVSAKRAIAISNFLKKLGLVGQFVAKGMGRAQTATPSARRVEVTITYQVKNRG
jgi:outer membrane protein OmpA-like peptidoglycan-associated protein